MPEPSLAKIRSFSSATKLGRWLKSNHDIEDELWIRVYKKASGKPSVSWQEIVIEALCWGWIDGMRKSLDDISYLQRITPRKRGSSWSKRNTEHVERLIKEGRMEEPGLAQVRSAKKDGRWENAYAPASEMTIPDDFLAAVESRPKAKKFFDRLGKSSRYIIAYMLFTAKRPETRQRRFNKLLDLVECGEKPKFF